VKTYTTIVYYLTPQRRRRRIYTGLIADNANAANAKAREMFAAERERMRGQKNFVEASIQRVASKVEETSENVAVANNQLDVHPAGFAWGGAPTLIGDKIDKAQPLRGIVVSVFNTLKGERTAVVEQDNGQLVIIPAL
jgi:hypothetical protein